MEYFTRSESGAINPVSNPEPFSYKTINMFCYKEGDEFRVTEKTTGCQVAVSIKSKNHAIETAEKVIEKFTPAGIKRYIDHALRTYNPPPPKPSSNIQEV